MISGGNICSTSFEFPVSGFQTNRVCKLGTRNRKLKRLFLWRIRILLLRLLLLRLLLTLRQFLALIQNLHVRTKSLVVLVLHDLLNVDVAHLEVQFVIRLRVSREPVLAVDLLPPAGELAKQVLLIALPFA